MSRECLGKRQQRMYTLVVRFLVCESVAQSEAILSSVAHIAFRRETFLSRRTMVVEGGKQE